MTTIIPLIFGLAAWGCCAAALIMRQQKLHLVSWILCAWALFFPLLQMHTWVTKNDVSAILDVTQGYLFAAGVLLSGNTLLTVLYPFLRGK